jgi:DinB family protein
MAPGRMAAVTSTPDASTPDTPIPDTPIPDDKDWTWVLDTPCPDCGFDAAAVEPTMVADLLRANTADWETLLGGDGVQVRSRPSPTVWSTLEYGCHLRDVHVLYLARLEMMLEQEGPSYPNWDQDETAIEKRYHEADPATVAKELSAAAEALAARFDQVHGAGWDRTGYRSDGAEFTVETFAKYFIHDPVHHLHDARTGGLSG